MGHSFEPTDTCSLVWQLISQPEVHAVKQTTLNGCLRAEYHIIYSHSYQVPVMYFRVHDLKGKLDYFWPHHNQITEIVNAVRLLILVCLLWFVYFVCLHQRWKNVWPAKAEFI